MVTGGGRGIGEKAVRKLVDMTAPAPAHAPVHAPQVGLGCQVVVGVRSPDSVRQVIQEDFPESQEMRCVAGVRGLWQLC